jgi:hypothetical protein
MDVVDAAIEQAGEDVDAAEKVFSHWLPILARSSRAVGHAPT